MGSNPADEFCLITRVLKHLEGRVQMFAICFKMHQNNSKGLMGASGVGRYVIQQPQYNVCDRIGVVGKWGLCKTLSTWW